ncbi:hypothetical protein F4778DRAFT_59978 [Xylariomycetidae sp. FL2044]|nr:hypothetical protein F4778DRAFT_59978 [Xylariomycetidae sp. FL2044]
MLRVPPRHRDKRRSPPIDPTIHILLIAPHRRVLGQVLGRDGQINKYLAAIEMSMKAGLPTLHFHPGLDLGLKFLVPRKRIVSGCLPLCLSLSLSMYVCLGEKGMLGDRESFCTDAVDQARLPRLGFHLSRGLRRFGLVFLSLSPSHIHSLTHSNTLRHHHTGLGYDQRPKIVVFSATGAHRLIQRVREPPIHGLRAMTSPRMPGNRHKICHPLSCDDPLFVRVTQVQYGRAKSWMVGSESLVEGLIMGGWGLYLSCSCQASMLRKIMDCMDITSLPGADPWCDHIVRAPLGFFRLSWDAVSSAEDGLQCGVNGSDYMECRGVTGNRAATARPEAPNVGERHLAVVYSLVNL